MILIGLLLAACAGALVGTQGIFNRHINVKVGGWAATTFILITGSLAALVIGLFVDGKDIFNFSEMKPYYALFGLVGIGVIFCTITAMKKIGATKTIILSVMAQLTASLVFDHIGLLVLPKVDIQWTQILGLIIMFAGIYIFNFEKKKTVE